MGTPIEDVEYGNDCVTCTPALFPAGKTPKYMKVVFHEIVRCPTAHDDPPNDVLFELTQSPANPCAWSVLIPDPFFVSFQLAPDFSQAYLVNSITLDSFFTTQLQPTCQSSPIPNELTCAAGQGEGGYMDYFWQPDSIPYTVAVDYSFCNFSDVVFDRKDCGIDHEIIKLARRADKTNCLFYIDKEEF